MTFSEIKGDTTQFRRKDIEGLRFVAIGSVVLGHFFPGVFPGGFLGVDIFFVISGYVITNQLAKSHTGSKTDDLLDFYSRRVRRLLPALIITTCTSLVLIAIIMTRPEGRMIRTGAFSLVGLANLYLYRIADDYFGLPAVQNPFTHTWSLGVEEQFYLLLPILFIISYRGPRKSGLMFNIVMVFTLFSFMLNFLLGTKYNNLTFYLLPTRIWELGCGVLCALLALRVPTFKINSEIFRMLGLVSYFYIFLTNRPNLILCQLLVISITTLLILPSDSNYAKRILSGKIPNYFGTRSYSLYLIHWPLLVFSNYLLGHGIQKNLILLFLATCLAHFSYKYIELPFRVGRYRANAAKTITYGVITATFFSLSIFFFGPRISQSYNNFLPNLLKVDQVPNWNPTLCPGKFESEVIIRDLNLCLGGQREPGQRFVYLLGDSHANQLQEMLKAAFIEPKFKIKEYNPKVDLHFPFAEFSISPTDNSFRYLENHAKSGDLIILAFHRGHLNPKRDTHIPIHEKIVINEITLNLIYNIDQFAGVMKRNGVQIILIRDTPLMGTIQTSESCALQLKLFYRSGCRISRLQDLHTRYLQDFAINRIESKNSNVLSWDPFPTIYQDKLSFDVLNEQGQYTMFDWNHISEITSKGLASGFIKDISSFINQQ